MAYIIGVWSDGAFALSTLMGLKIRFKHGKVTVYQGGINLGEEANTHN